MPVDIENDGEPHEGAAPSSPYEEPATHVFETDDDDEHPAQFPGQSPLDHIPHSPEFPPSPTLDPPSEHGEPSPEPNPPSSAHPETPGEDEEPPPSQPWSESSLIELANLKLDTKARRVGEWR